MSDMPATDSPPQRILIACVGNIFLGDDGFGVEVARHLDGRRFPAGVEVVDFGIRGVELAYSLLEGYDTLVLVDALPRRGPPGTLYLIEPDIAGPDPEQGALAGQAALDAHSMDPVKVLAFARTLGAPAIRTLVVGCEPGLPAEGDEAPLAMELSPPVRAAVAEAVTMIDGLVARLCAEGARVQL